MNDVLTLPKKIASATLRRWLVEPPARIEADQLVLEAETEEALVEIRASRAVTVAKILCPAGTTVAAGQALAELDDAMNAPANTLTEAAPVAAQEPAPSGPVATPPGTTVVLMPKAGQTMEEGTIVAWKLAEGDAVSKGDVLFEVETDKAVLEEEAKADGVLRKILVGDGDTVPVRVPVAVIAPADADIDAFVAALPTEAAEEAAEAEPMVAEAAQPAAPAAPIQRPEGRLFASPAARRRAKELGIDLTTVPGTGANGRVKVRDVEATAAAPPVAVPPVPTGEPRRIEMTRMRRAIAQNLSWSKQNIPHFYATVTVDVAGLRQAHKILKKALGVTINDLVVAATAKTIAEFPEFRCRFEDDGITELPGVNIGIAVGTEDGLRVPVLENADRLSLIQLSQGARKIVETARQSRMSAAAPASFTITNMGMFGVEDFSAIINPPESGILAVSTARREPVVKNGSIVPGEVMTLTLSCDHRVVDGIVAARFLGHLKTRLEDVETLLEETASG